MLNDFFADSFLQDNQIKIEKALIKKSENLVVLNFKFATILPINVFETFLKDINRFKKNFKQFDYAINISYDNFDLENEKLYLSYLNYLLRESLDYSLMNFSSSNSTFKDGTFTIIVPDLSKIAPSSEEKIVKLFNAYSIPVKVKIEELNRDEVKEMINAKEKTYKEEMNKAISAQKEEVAHVEAIKKYQKEAKPFKARQTVQGVDPISKIPSTPSGIDEYINVNGPANFNVEGEVFFVEGRRLNKPDTFLYQISITDGTDSITLKTFCNESQKQAYDELKNGDRIQAYGIAQYDTYSKEVTMTIRSFKLLGKTENVIPEDKSEVKRVELHLHSNMSALDAITPIEKYVDRALYWGQKAIAVTDHDGVYSYHDLMLKTDKTDCKPIYGVELGYVDEDNYHITFTDTSRLLKESSYVVFDLETTGFSVLYDRIIQIGAVKVKGGLVVDQFNSFVNPLMHIPQKVQNLTSITDETVKEAETIDVVLPKFLEFIGDSILVAHNATFDVSHIYENMKNLGIKRDKPFDVIDTLQIARNFYADELKRFNLAAMAKLFKVNQEHHHLADDDTRVTAECFIKMLDYFYQHDIYNYNELNKKINPKEMYKHVIPSHINILVKNQVGYKNMFKVLSDSLTTHFFNESRVLKSVLESLHDGILVGSGCYNGEVYELALNRSDEDLERAMLKYDYIEVQPADIYACTMKRDDYDDVNYLERAKATIERIVRTAKKLGKICVATSDCHYLDKNEKEFRDIYISAPQLGGGTHTLASCVETPDQHYRSTDEMLDNFAFLGEKVAYEIVVENTNKIADMIENVVAFKSKKEDLYSPADDEFNTSLGVPSIKEDLLKIVYENAYKNYGNPLPKYVSDRLDKELNSIINNGYSPVYYMAYLLVKKSNDDGYVVGSRGSVGSSFVATMMKITEVNPLAPHYFCKKCHFAVFKLNEEEKAKYPLDEKQMEFNDILQKTNSGYDLPRRVCPCCGESLSRDGQDIPFETFLGFKGDKTPDIDLNFSGLYQPTAHEYIRELMGPENAFRAGTVTTVAENTAIGYVKGHIERKHIELRNTEIKRIAKHIEGVRRSTGQHPGGIVVVPSYKEIYDVTPIQYPADKIENNWRTTHFEYHSFEANLLKLDILGHDDPTMLRFIFDYVEAHPDEFPFKTPQEIPIDDENVRKMFYETDCLGLKNSDIESKVATFALPEFGTKLSRGLLEETLPKTFAELVKISGLSHGTGVWGTNAQELFQGNTEFGKIPFADIIGCRDDIMVDLIYFGLQPSDAFTIMEYVRKGKAAKGEDPVKWDKFKSLMTSCPNVPSWYPWSCGKIEYMFPKAHAVAYVLMAMRIAWFKYHKPLVFYSAFFTIRANQFEPDVMLEGLSKIKSRICDLKMIKSPTAKEDDLLTMYTVAVEMIKRGFIFLPVDIRYSHATTFEIEGKGLRLPFVAIPGLGESVAKDVMKRRELKPFTSKEDVSKNTKLNKTLFEKMNAMGAFADLPDEDDEPTGDDITSGLFSVFEEEM